jgi:transposase
MLLPAFYSIRPERLEYDLLFSWFVGTGVDDGASHRSVFLKNRGRLLEGDLAAKILEHRTGNRAPGLLCETEL